jgi:hypothetical protein
MARRKRISKVLEKASQRISGMRSMSESLDFGNGVSLADYEFQMNDLRATLLDYNTLLSTLDEAARQVKAKEDALRNYTERMLLNTAARYGRESSQYLQAGGKPRVARRSKRSVAVVSEVEVSEVPQQRSVALQASMN